MLKKIFPFIIIFALFGSSCNDTLDEINTNPNATSTAFPDFLLTGTLKQGADLYWGSENNFGSTMLFVQYWAAIQYPDVDRFDVSNNSFTGLWNKGYATLIKDLNTILDLPAERANNNYKGVALALRSWTFLLLTDAYGDVPYTEASLKDEVWIPKYDAQRDVYLALLSDLKKAQSLLDVNGERIFGDVIFNPSNLDNKNVNITNWKKIVNSLRLRIALRIADRESALAKQTILDAQADPAGFIAGNSDIFQFNYIASPQWNPIAANFYTRNDYRVSATIVDKLYDLSDPRLSVYAERPDSVPDRYVGLPNAIRNPSDMGFARTSKPGTYFRRADAPAVIYSYSEVLFNLSEAVARGYITGDADEYYNKAITASLSQFGITDPSIIENYLAQPKVKYDPTNFRKSIGDQKWIALYGQGLEAFAEWRRLGYPELKAGPESVLEGKIPVRFFYPGTEQSLNRRSYTAAVQNQGEDKLTTPLWFFKR